MGKVCPNIDRLAGVGQTGRIQPILDDGGLLWSLYAPMIPSGSMPALGGLSALGLGMPFVPNRTWARMDFAHLRQLRDRLIFVSPERAGLLASERTALAHAMTEVLEEHGWTLHPFPNTLPMLISSDQPLVASVLPLERLEGASLLDHQPQGPDGLAILDLVTHGQMVLARHVVNKKRSQEGHLPLNTPWIWGIGNQIEVPSIKSHAGICLSTDAAVCGMAMAAGFSGFLLHPEWSGDGFRKWLAMVLNANPAPGMIHLHIPVTIARGENRQERLQWLSALDAEFIAPLTVALASADRRLMIVGLAYGTDNQEDSWVMAAGRRLIGKRWFWMKHSMGQGERVTPEDLRQWWLDTQ
ncbi:MAG: hypothetical protein H7839_15065 [Magnetococcus sp. YQC-5]